MPDDTHQPPGMADLANLAAAVQRALVGMDRAPLQPGLHIVATPIGNLGDITLRALAVLARADVIYCEDTRHSPRLLHHYAIQRPLAPYHEHNAQAERPRILERLRRGEAVALISDAGTPLISDPGYKLVQAARAAGHGVWCLPGPSSPIAALSVAGLPTDHFTFEGFLPPRATARKARLAALRDVTGTLVFLEAPQRLADCLADMRDTLGDRAAAVARELTKLHEAVRLGSLSELAAWAEAQPVRGEIVILVAPAPKGTIDDVAITAGLCRELERATLRDAVSRVAEALQVPRNRVYQLALALRR